MMRYIISVSILFLAIVGLCFGDIVDTGVLKSDYTDDDIQMMAMDVSNGIVKDVQTIKIDARTNRIIL